MKALMLAATPEDLESLLDRAARSFSQAVQGKEGQEGTVAFYSEAAASLGPIHQ